MTDKKEKILYAALDLFANDGYNVTSTNKIAKKAGVSEGLIFRHFENKKGLLNAIMNDAEKRINEIFSHIIFETDPIEVIRKVIELPYSIDKKNHAFWRLQFKLKWEQEYFNPKKMLPLLEKLEWAFSELNFTSPKMEAIILSHINESISVEILRDNLHNPDEYKSFLMKRYKV